MQNFATQSQLPKNSAFHQKPKNATETGFIGEPKEWFSDDEFKKQVCADLSKADHDYYYGSYSSYYIHEEMLKDAVRTRAY